MLGFLHRHASGCLLALAIGLMVSAGSANAGRPTAPPCLITGVLSSCKPSQLCGPGPSDLYFYQWTGPHGFESTLPCIDASETGTYSLIVTDRKTGASSGPCSVFYERTPETCSITGDLTICRGETTELCGPEKNVSFHWTGPNGFTSQERCITVSTLGVYRLDTFDGYCEEVCSVEVVLDGNCGSESEGRCWMTGGGAEDGERGKIFDWGGNVNPGCHPERGSWNHVDRVLDLHFQGYDIHVERCGNVEEIPAGSTSPVTPFNFIEFSGPGRFMGKGGNHTRWQSAFFFARVEDRAEPGSNGQPDPNAKDRYFLHVFTNPADPNGSTVLLVDQDGDPATVDPMIIDRGNLQLHISSCDEGGVPGIGLRSVDPLESNRSQVASPVPSRVWLAAPGPNPARFRASLKFGLPRDGDVALTIFDVTGRAVRRLVSGRYPAGEHETVWDLSDDDANPVSGGVFFARLVVDGRTYGQPLTVIH